MNYEIKEVSMSIQWFPGHMYKTKQALNKLIKEIDIVVELLDARSPFSSCNPLLQSIIKNKQRIRILNKNDLADPSITKLWLNYFSQQNSSLAITGNINDHKQAKKIINLCRTLRPNRNSFEKPLRVMITGIPNVGKSSLINQLIGKKSALTGDVPAVTKTNQCLMLADDFLIYDTPGMMWQKIKYSQIGYNLALCNSIGRNALDEELIAVYLIKYLVDNYPQELCSRYKLTESISDLNENELLLLIGKKRGCVQAKNIIDRQKISEIIIQDFRDGRIGKISLETPDMWDRWIAEAVVEEETTEDETL
jgi:ribosome biogenesis GTPase A